MFDVVLLVTVHLADVLENANEDILTAMHMAVARILYLKPSGGSHTLSVPKSHCTQSDRRITQSNALSQGVDLWRKENERGRQMDGLETSGLRVPYAHRGIYVKNSCCHCVRQCL